MSAPNHGDYAMYQQEMRDDGKACDLCRQARNTYMQQWRGMHPEHHQLELLRRRARYKALSILGRRHAAELYDLIEEQMDRLLER